MMTEKLQIALNDQLNAELWSSNLYLSMAFHMEKMGYNGFCCKFKKLAQKETDDACEIASYLAKKGCDAKIDKINVVPTDWGTAVQVCEHLYKHTVHLAKMTDKLLDIAMEEKDHATKIFLSKFVACQMEEEAMAHDLYKKAKNAGDAGLMVIDAQLHVAHKILCKCCECKAEKRK